jgi:membrane peptidoglycan carboxypeptidase
MSALPLLRRRRERRSLEKQRSQGRLTRGTVGLGLLLAVILGGLILGGAFTYASVTADLPSLDLLPQLLDPLNGSLLQPTRVYDRSGAHLLTALAPAQQAAPRSYAPLEPTAPEHIPDTLIRATLALSDPGFRTHPGYLLAGLFSPDDHPTLAQKLAVDLLLWDEAPGLRRALRERILAAQITSHFGRDQVLEWYLNSASYGRFAYGADNASRLYFGKPVTQLNLAEAALLAAVNESPAINPLDAPQAAVQRGLEALNTIQARGLATAEETQVARFFPLSFQPAPAQSNSAPAFTALALSQLESRFNRARVERGGMVVLTTLDFELQQRAACAVQTQLAHLNGATPQPCQGAESLPPLPPGQNAPEAAASAAVLDPRSGQVLALVGDSKPGTESAFLTPHRPGTLLTPFVYLAGFTRGLSPATLTWDIPPAGTAAPDTNFTYHGPLRLRQAFANDYPLPAAQVFDQMGAALVQQTMTPFGLSVPADSFKELVETENRYSVIQIAQSYGVFAAQGALIGQTSADGLIPSSLLAVKGADGRPYADWSVPASEQVVSGQLAYLVTDVLGLPDLGRPAAVKPGQASAGAEAWTAGYTPQRVTVVWMGGEGLSRASMGLWTSIMQSASHNLPPDGWPLPAGMLRLKVCDPSGLLPTEACPNVVDEVFIDGYQPVQADMLYRTYAINRETGFLATVFTPLQLVEQRVYMQVPPEAQDWAKTARLQVPPTQYDSIQPPALNPEVNLTSPAMFAELKGKVTIRGTAGGDDFAFYRLQYGRGLNPENWVQIGADVKTPVSQGTLAAWDTSGLQGLYTLQLLVVRADNSLQTATVQVTVNNP